jgi:hypothetical protein
MKRKHEETSKYQHLVGQLLTLFFSGVYITSYDMLEIGKKLGYTFPSKHRELILKTLFLECEKENKMHLLIHQLIQLINGRIMEYQALSKNYPDIQEVSFLWIQKANTMIKLLQQHLRANPYE